MKRLWRVTVALAPLFACHAVVGADISTLESNAISRVTASVPSNSTIASELTDYVATGSLAGSFSDINYADTSAGTWSPSTHIDRLHDFVVAWDSSSSTYYHSATLQADIVATYNYWMAHSYASSNWWWNDIGVPDSLSESMMIMQNNPYADILPTSNLATAEADLNKAATGQTQLGLTGANLVWTAYPLLNEGMLNYQAPGASSSAQSTALSLIDNSFTQIDSTFALDPGNGLVVDQAYQFHGNMLYNGGYGLDWMDDVCGIASEAAGTAEGVSTTDLNAMIDEILDADQFMTRGQAFDLTTLGRDIARATGQTSLALDLRGDIQDMLKLDPTYRTTALQNYYNSLVYSASHSGNADPTLTAVGNREFWTSDYMAQQRNGYMISVKTVSTRTVTPEGINSENLFGNYTYSGANLIYVTGNEYENIEPVWDWYRIPGTTSERSSTGTGGTYSILPSSKAGPTAFSGGASDGNIGAVGYQFSQYNITADKSYFLFNTGEVAMGAGITQTTPEVSGDVVGTDINQTLLNGTVYYSTAPGASISLASGQTVSPANLRWVNHNNVGYFFLTPVSNATIRTIAQSGNWYAIDTSYSSTTVTDNVFSLDLNHGATPSGASYLYAIIPGETPAQMDSYLASNPFTVLSNTTTVQAITDNINHDTEATFYSAGSIAISSSLKLTQVTSGQGSSVLWEQNGSVISMYVASPTHYTGTLSFTVSSDLTGTGASWSAATGLTTLTVSLPTGSDAGSTVSETYTVVPEPGTFAACSLAVLAFTRRNRPPLRGLNKRIR